MERPSQLPPGADSVPVGGRPDQGSGQDLAQLFERECCVRALDTSGVGVEGRVQRAFGRREVAQDEVQGLGDHDEILGSSTVLPRVQIGPGQLRLIGQHLLEVRNEPARVGGVAAEPADQVVVDAARRHAVERPQAHVPGVGRVGPATAGAPEAKLDEGGPGEFRCRAEAAPFGVEASRQAADHLLDQDFRVEADRGGRSGQAEHLGALPLTPPRRRHLPLPRSAPRPGGARGARRPRARRPARGPGPARWPRRRPAPARRGGRTASRVARRAGSRSRRRRGARRACRRPTWASPRTRSGPGWRPCRRHRDRAAPRGRPSPK